MNQYCEAVQKYLIAMLNKVSFSSLTGNSTTPASPNTTDPANVSVTLS